MDDKLYFVILGLLILALGFVIITWAISNPVKRANIEYAKELHIQRIIIGLAIVIIGIAITTLPW
jgi:hydrogenase/urease accessory protein HupE